MVTRLWGPIKRLAVNRWLWFYAALLIASHIFIAVEDPDPWEITGAPVKEATRRTVTVPAMTDTGADPAGGTLSVSVLCWKPGTPGPGFAEHAPVIVLHGSPSGGASDFRRLAPLLANSEGGRDVYGIDFPGFGRSETGAPDYSIIANARVALAVMDALKVQRAHVVGWSQGGGSAIYMADLAPQRVASLSLLGAIGIQEAEGSGSYYFEHIKYGTGYVLLVMLPELVPDFGLLGPDRVRLAFIRNFMDTDQRLLEPIMQKLTTPTLLIHGQRDVMVPLWCAERSHDLIAPSTLVTLDSGHMFPMGVGHRGMQAMAEAAASMLPFFALHDAPGVEGAREKVDQTGEDKRKEPTVAGIEINRSTAWWAVILIIVVGTLIIEDLTVIAVGILIVDGAIDPFVGLAGCFVGICIGDIGLWLIGRILGQRILRWKYAARMLSPKKLEELGRLLDTHTGKAVFLSRCLPGTRMPTYITAGMLTKRTGKFAFYEFLAVCVWTPLLLLLSSLVGPPLLELFRKLFHGPLAIVLAFIAAYVLIRIVTSEATYEGRHRTKTRLRRIFAHEFWPAWVLYLPLVPRLWWMGLVRGGPMSFTCANPGIPFGGGIIGESKSAILNGFRSGPVSPHRLISADGTPAERAARAIEVVRSDGTLGGYPVILKPDAAQRGHAVRLARSDADIQAYFAVMTRAVMVQRFEPGPREIGVMWSRRAPAGSAGANGTKVDEWPGFIYSITKKVFPVVLGDGLNTLEHLIWDHPRYQLQAQVFLKRFEGRLDRVPAAGESVNLALSGNHCQGVMFLDAPEMGTPELERAIDEIAQAFRDEQGRRIDFGRFDLRYSSEEELARGRGFVIVEFNGTASESTTIYDPRKSVWWAWNILKRQWELLYAIGAARRRAGARALSAGEIIRAARAFFETLPGSSVAD